MINIVSGGENKFLLISKLILIFTYKRVMKIFDLIMSVTQCNIMHYCSKVSFNFTHDFSVHENCFSTFREIWVKFKDFLLLYQIQEVKIT